MAECLHARCRARSRAAGAIAPARSPRLKIRLSVDLVGIRRRRRQDYALALACRQFMLRLQKQRAIGRQITGCEDSGGLLGNGARLRRATSRDQSTCIPKLRNTGMAIVGIETEPERCRLFEI